jgi:hypothetical protein
MVSTLRGYQRVTLVVWPQPAALRARELLATLRAATVDLEPMRLDVIAGASSQLGEQPLDVARGEVVHGAAPRADDVMVMSPAVRREAVLQRAVVEDDLADRADLLQQLERTEDGRATDSGRRGSEALGSEVVAHRLDRGQQTSARLRDAVAAAQQLVFQEISSNHSLDRLPASKACQLRAPRSRRVPHNGRALKGFR